METEISQTKIEQVEFAPGVEPQYLAPCSIVKEEFRLQNGQSVYGSVLVWQ